MKKNLKCLECGREMPNKNWKTKNGCQWCDVEFYNYNFKLTPKRNKQMMKRINDIQDKYELAGIKRIIAEMEKK